MKYNIILILIIILFAACNENNDSLFITSPIDEDYSSIVDPKERWEAYQLTNYYIDQQWACECFPPNSCNTYIINDSVVDVKYELLKKSYYGRSEEEVYNYTKNQAMTVDEAFSVIHNYKTNAHKIEVEYDSRFGFPIRIYIDIDSLMADEEIIRKFSNLKKIVE